MLFILDIIYVILQSIPHTLIFLLKIKILPLFMSKNFISARKFQIMTQKKVKKVKISWLSRLMCNTSSFCSLFVDTQHTSSFCSLSADTQHTSSFCSLYADTQHTSSFCSLSLLTPNTPHRSARSLPTPNTSSSNSEKRIVGATRCSHVLCWGRGIWAVKL